MAKKRKHDSKATTAEATEPPQKQQHQEEEKPQQEEEAQKQNQIAEEEEEEEEEIEEYEQVIEEVEEEVEVEEEEEEEEANDEDDDDPIEKLLEPFGKEQLINLLREAADTHRDVADHIRKIADADPVHRKIFVHGLGWDTSAETLTNAFKQYGEIEDCKAVCDKVSGKSKGYGFILFKKRSGARKALQEPQKKIGNRMTACQLASIGPVPVGQAAASAVTTSHHPQHQQVSDYTRRKIYVSNVAADLDPKELTNFFSKFGEIEEGPLGLDKLTGKPKGFCLFVYKSAESAKRALEEPHKSFEGHMLHCQKAIDGPKHGKPQQQQQQHYNAQKSHFQRNGNPGYSGGTASGPSHLMAPAAGGPGIGFNEGAAGAPALNPALGQALTALLATQGAGLGLNLLGTLGSAAGLPAAAPGMQNPYGNQAGSYGHQGVMHGTYPSQGSSGRGQHGAGQYGGVGPYMGH
ncbi:UBP1-associated protein 2A [Ricinus communis]|uniref:Heterogeneous nuclear ribonucleoprotein A1, putative n=1 Tax=Ricinus communis TaxID=3988 RepID=B9SU32_RICCO|nr:UBP1-associated protein 2A [Ricinus communis]EEF32870.1 Heterogeneous nuclear ribonucleoprotein A1, putative [Ricinus communis]|eukprot:XP_002529501.1 UBP1-associated protein 2A [Ricinus communis]